jgi:hypothetical protein
MCLTHKCPVQALGHLNRMATPQACPESGDLKAKGAGQHVPGSAPMRLTTLPLE